MGRGKEAAIEVLDSASHKLSSHRKMTAMVSFPRIPVVRKEWTRIFMICT